MSLNRSCTRYSSASVRINALISREKAKNEERRIMKMSKLFIRTKEGKELEILSGSHVYLKVPEEEVYLMWEAVPVIQQDLDHILTNAEEMLKEVKEIISAHSLLTPVHKSRARIPKEDEKI
jgi:hypothetical protein